MRPLLVEPLSAAAFAPFGAVIEFGSAPEVYPINAGSAMRHHALATVDLLGGQAAISLLRAQAFALPIEIRLLERHPLGTQAFIPLTPLSYLVVVAQDPTAPRAFMAHAGQGVQYHRGCWHHPLLALQSGDFLIVDRIGAGDNCEVIDLPEPWALQFD